MSRGHTRRDDGAMTGTQGLLHEEIIRVAAVCFAEAGYRATTLDTIAAKVGISKVTLYKHVPSKEELLCRMFERTIRSFRAGLRRIVEQPLTADEKLRRIIRYQVTQVATQLSLLRVFFSEEGSLPAAMARRVAREKREYDRAIERVVGEGIAAGRVRDLPPTLLVFGLLGLCNWLHKWYRPEGPLAPEEIAGVLTDLLERGYLEPRSRADQEDLAGRLDRIDRRLAVLERRSKSDVERRGLDIVKSGGVATRRR